MTIGSAMMTTADQHESLVFSTNEISPHLDRIALYHSIFVQTSPSRVNPARDNTV